MSKRYQGGILGVGFNPLRAPNAPTIGTATAGGNNCASVAFTAPACVGGSAITGYTARSEPTGFGAAAAGSPITVTGLTNGSSYTFGAFALNSYGPSPISAFSNSITAALDGTLSIFALGNPPATNTPTQAVLLAQGLRLRPPQFKAPPQVTALAASLRLDRQTRAFVPPLVTSTHIQAALSAQGLPPLRRLGKVPPQETAR